MQSRRKIALPGLIVLLIIGFLFFQVLRNRSKPSDGTVRNQQTGLLNRDKYRLAYSRHARCRMACREVDSTEVIEILEEGSINYRKTDTTGSRDPKFALEGRTHDGQRLRIVFAMAEMKTVVVTVIDLDQDNDCSCP